jgi:vacuolar-type H+-ATPase subunit E/Vma4
MSATDTFYPMEELTTEAKEEIKNKIKKIEENILSQISKYNEEIKLADKLEVKLRSLQTKVYTTSERLRKTLRNISNSERNELEDALTTLDSEVQLSLNETLDAKNTALVSLQHLYKDHVDYLSQIVNGLKTRCENLENRRDNLLE